MACVQAMVKPAVVRLLRERQLPVHQVLSNLLAYDDDGCPLMEIDLLVVNSEVAVAVVLSSGCTWNRPHPEIPSCRPLMSRRRWRT